MHLLFIGLFHGVMVSTRVFGTLSPRSNRSGTTSPSRETCAFVFHPHRAGLFLCFRRGRKHSKICRFIVHFPPCPSSRSRKGVSHERRPCVADRMAVFPPGPPVACPTACADAKERVGKREKLPLSFPISTALHYLCCGNTPSSTQLTNRSNAKHSLARPSGKLHRRGVAV